MKSDIKKSCYVDFLIDQKWQATQLCGLMSVEWI